MRVYLAVFIVAIVLLLALNSYQGKVIEDQRQQIRGLEQDLINSPACTPQRWKA